MITLLEYQKKLVDYYHDKIDDKPAKRQARYEYLMNYYGEELLNKIITDTYEFMEKLLTEPIKEYYYIPLDNEHYSKLISLNLCGGWFSDQIYQDLNGNLISQLILKEEFGQDFHVNVECREYICHEKENNNYLNISSYDCYNYLYLRDFPTDIKEIKTKILAKK